MGFFCAFLDFMGFGNRRGSGRARGEPARAEQETARDLFLCFLVVGGLVSRELRTTMRG